MYFYFLEMLVKAVTIPITLKKKKQKKIEERNNVEEVRKVMETLSSHD